MKLLSACFAAALAMMPMAAAAQGSWTADNGNGTFTNPLFYDEFSDPDILRVGDDYYLAGTTMHTVPGVNILHSKDLVNWEQVSYCFDRFDFADPAFSLQDGKEVYGQGVWAPCIRYSNGKFYVFTNVNGKGLQAYIASDIKGPWEHVMVKGNIYDLSVLFDDDGKIYAIHGYGTVKCCELKPDLSEPVPGTDRVIIPEGTAVGEGHHMYKINGMYYLISTDYKPNGRTLCSRSKSIWGPYETITITADETYGYHAAPMTQVRGRIVDNGTPISIAMPDKGATACSNAHQGGIVSTPDGQWWALLMQDFHSIGRTVCLMPITWTDGWPMIGLPGNPGRAPRTWLKPSTGHEQTAPHAPYNRNEDFNGKQLGRIWQWNHNPDEKMWSLKGGKLRIESTPASQLLWARNTLTQRAIGPVSQTIVELDVSHLKDGDVAGLGNINMPCSWIGVQKEGSTLQLKWFQQLDNDTVAKTVAPVKGKIWLMLDGDYDNDRAIYKYSLDGQNYEPWGKEMTLSYQLITFQGSRPSLFVFNSKGKRGGYALFDNFKVVEPKADRSGNIPYGKTIRIINLATGNPAEATPHGVLYDAAPHANRPINRFRLIDKGQGKVIVQCEDGRYLMASGIGMPGDVRMTKNEQEAEVFMYQDYLDQQFMLMSFNRHTYLCKCPTTGSPYSVDCKGPDPARMNGSVFRWELVE